MRAPSARIFGLLPSVAFLFSCTYEDVATKDEIPPRLIATSPSSDASDVPLNAGLELSFSEPMAKTKGSIQVVQSGLTTEITAVQGRWDSAAIRFGFRPSTPFTAGTVVTVTQSGFNDVAGNPLPSSSFSFTTGAEPDRTAPTVLRSSPNEGAGNVDPSLSEIAFTFSEPMSAVVGTATLEGAPGTLGDLVWTADDTLEISIRGLAPETSYRVVLRELEDISGNPLDGMPVLGDGALDFTTSAAPDTTAPTVLSSTPAEGAIDLTAGLGAIVVRFSEPMNPSAGSSSLMMVGSSTSASLSPNWSAQNTIASFDVGGLIVAEAAYSLSFEGYADAAGNLLDGAPYLQDGALDFATSALPDTTRPRALGSTPTEGAIDVPAALTTVTISFDEAMLASNASATLTLDAANAQSLLGTWSAANTVISFDVSGLLATGRDVRIDVSQLEDVAGNRLDGVPFLVNGALDFSTEATPDTVRPRVTASNPAESATVMMPPASILLTFSEPMNVSAGVATLEGPGGSTVVNGSWSAGGTALSLNASALLDYGSSYRVNLVGYEDLAQNPLDGGPYLGDGALDFAIGPAPDLTPPTVLTSTPAEGATLSGPISEIRLSFSEPMNPALGTATLIGSVSTALQPVWTAGNTELRFDVTGLIAYGTTYRVTLVDFEDPAGNVLDGGPYLIDNELDFSVGPAPDTTRPTVVNAVPFEASNAVDPTLASIAVSFSEPMDTTITAAPFAMGAAMTTLTAVWSQGGTLATFDLSTVTLVFDEDYALALGGFSDPAGNPLDGAPVLGDGVLNFRTTAVPDTTRPTVLSTTPAEGALITTTLPTSLVVNFSESMSSTFGTATLIAGASSTPLVGVWSAGDTVVTYSLTGLLAWSTSYRVSFAGFQDLAGNTLDTAPYLGNGELDFATGTAPDTTAPFVINAVPLEASSATEPTVAQIFIRFSEPMDASITTAPFTYGGTSTNLSATWSNGDRDATFDLSSVTLAYNQAESLDLRGFRDVAQNALNPAPELGNGILDFSTRLVPTGENCTDPLGLAQGTPVGNALVYTVAAGQVTTVGGSFACDPTGIGNDVVIEYAKTSANLAGGGRLLHVRATSATANANLNVEISSGNCDVTDVGATQDKCVWNKESWEAYVDVPAGNHWIWIGAENNGAFPGATIEIEEVLAADAEGEGCWLPWSTASANYAAPATGVDYHEWTIAAADVQSFDISQTWGEPASISCVNDATYGDLHGVDTVIAFDKASAASTILVEASSLDGTTPIHIEVLDRCDSNDTLKVSHACQANSPNLSAAFSTGTAGTIYLWLAVDRPPADWPGALVRVREQTVDLGETCASAQVLGAPGAITLSKVSNDRFDAPSCFVTPGPIDWYRYTVTSDNLQLFTNLAGELAVLDGTGTTELGCFADGSRFGYGTQLTIGTSVCIAVPSNAAATQLTVADPGDVYAGVGTTTTPLVVTPTVAWANARWLTSSPTRLYLGLANEIVEIPKTSSVSIPHGAADGVSAANLGYAGLARANEHLFSLDDLATASTSRVYRLFDGALFVPTVFDTSPAYPAEDLRGLCADATSLLVSTQEAGQVRIYSLDPTAPSTPVLIGTNTQVELVSGLAADNQYVYLAGLGPDGEGVYRLARADLGVATTVPDTLVSGVELDLTAATPIFIDDPSGPSYLYFRSYDPAEIRVVAAPASPAPIDLGVLSSVGNVGDYGMVYDATESVIYFMETVNDAAGRLVRLE